MLNINWIKEQIANGEWSVTCNIPDHKGNLRNLFAKGQDVISFDHENSEMNHADKCTFNSLLDCFTCLEVLKKKGANCYTRFSLDKIDWNDVTYGMEKRKLTRVLAEMLGHFDTMNDIYHAWRERSLWPSDYTRYFGNYCERIGRLPRAFENNPLDMTPAIFTAWLGEQIARLKRGTKVQYTIDFRPEASLLAGNGKGFKSCFGLPFFPHQEGTCYNNSPSAYAYSNSTAILYSMSEDGHSLTNRAWIYFVNDSVYFGRFYGNDINRETCRIAAQAMGFNTDISMTELGHIANIVQGNIYRSDQIEIGFGPCYESDYIDLQTRCIACGESLSYGNDESSCLCDECREEDNGLYCEKCGDRTDSDDLVYVDNYGSCCTNCARECMDCGEYHLRANMTDVGGQYRTRYICESCLDNWSYCEHCEDWTQSDNSTYLDNLCITVCDYCKNEAYVECNVCNEWTSKDDAFTCTDCGEYVCSDCYVTCDICKDVTCDDCKVEHVFTHNSLSIIKYLCSDCNETVEAETLETVENE